MVCQEKKGKDWIHVVLEARGLLHAGMKGEEKKGKK